MRTYILGRGMKDFSKEEAAERGRLFEKGWRGRGGGGEINTLCELWLIIDNEPFFQRVNKKNRAMS